MMTWVKGDKTTVVHVEDYGNMVCHSNITDGGERREVPKVKVAVIE